MVTAYIETPTFSGMDLKFPSRNDLVKFVRAACEHTYKPGQTYAAGYDRRGTFMVVATATHRPKLDLVTHEEQGAST